MVVDQAIRGLFTEQDYDFYRVTTTGEPQLWQVDATGSGISALRWVQADGTELGTGDITEGHALLTDLYLIPGNHWLRVDGSNGEYSLALTALGPPDPNSEREPNNQALNAEPFAAGQTRTGRLPTISDVDVFRITVDSADHLRFSVTPPDDAAVQMHIDGGGQRVSDVSGELGIPTVYEAVLQPGDYEISLWSRTDPSAGRYSLGVERLDPFLVPADQEPNNTMGMAAPLPPSLHVDGTTPESGDLDWYAFPVLPDRRRSGCAHGRRSRWRGRVRWGHRLRRRRGRRHGVGGAGAAVGGSVVAAHHRTRAVHVRRRPGRDRPDSSDPRSRPRARSA